MIDCTGVQSSLSLLVQTTLSLQKRQLFYILNILINLYNNKCSATVKCKSVRLEAQTRTGKTERQVGRTGPVYTGGVVPRVRPLGELGQAVQGGAVAVHRPPG